jgi:hypothetical protein
MALPTAPPPSHISGFKALPVFAVDVYVNFSNRDAPGDANPPTS